MIMAEERATWRVKLRSYEEVVNLLLSKESSMLPWNIPKGKTVEIKKLANEVLANSYYYTPSTKPGISTVEAYVDHIYTKALEVAEQYEVGFERSSDEEKYTFFYEDDDEEDDEVSAPVILGN